MILLETNLAEIHDLLGTNEEGYSIVDNMMQVLLEDFDIEERIPLSISILVHIISSIDTSP